MKYWDSLRPPSLFVSNGVLIFLALVITANNLNLRNVPHENCLRYESATGRNVREETAVSNSPEVLIYRRTKKTGSTSMLEAILKGLTPESYTALYNVSHVLSDIVRAEVHRPSPRKLFIGSHNGISREHTGNRRTVIIDTVADGYKQMTSFCRYVQRVSKCESDEMRECLRSGPSRSQLRYRWAGRPQEDSETYIDLPLSSAHPALSATIFRRVFPHITIDIAKNNVFGSSCEETANLRKFYDEIYQGLDQQVLMLRKRMLTLAGYPSEMDGFSVEQLLDAADKAEEARYANSLSISPRNFKDIFTSTLKAHPKVRCGIFPKMVRWR